MNVIMLVFLLCGIYSWAGSTANAAVHRYKRDDLMLRSVMSLRLRLEELEDVTKELRTELKQLKTAAKVEISTEQVRAPDTWIETGELPDNVIQKVVEVARIKLRTDLAVIKSGLINEKERTVEMTEALKFCKAGVTSFASRLDYFTGSFLEFGAQLDDVNGTVCKLRQRMNRVPEIIAQKIHDVNGTVFKLRQQMDRVPEIIAQKIHDVNGTVFKLQQQMDRVPEIINNKIHDVNGTVFKLQQQMDRVPEIIADNIEYANETIHKLRNEITGLKVLPLTTASPWLNEFDKPVHYQCEEEGYLSEVRSIYSNVHQDRRWQYNCRNIPNRVVLRTCKWYNDVDPFQVRMAFRCPDKEVITGVKSRHDNKHEDRVFGFRCCRIVERKLDNCVKTTTFLNQYEGPLHFSAQPNYAFVGLSSFFNGDYEDRLWYATVCELVK